MSNLFTLKEWLRKSRTTMTDKTTQKRPADKALEIAKEMLAKGFDVETIMEITGLDKETVLMLGKSA